MNELYTYLRKKLKSKNIRIEEFASMCGFSKSTLYRYMKGNQTIPNETEQKMGELLGFNNYEKQEFHNILNSVYIDTTMIGIRENLYKLIFNQDRETNQESSLELILYDGDRYIRTLNEVFGMIFKMSEYKNFGCEINMIGCTSQNVFCEIQKFLNQKSIKTNILKLDHIVNISDINYSETANTIRSIFPLFEIYNYNIYYTNYENNDENISILNDFMIIKCKYNQTDVIERFFFITFLKDRFSGCYVCKEKNLYNFFIQNYVSILQRCKKSEIKFRNFNSLKEFYEKIKKGVNIYSIQSAPVCDKLPINIIEQEFLQYNDKQLVELVNSLSDKKNTIETAREYISYIIDFISRRTELSKSNNYIDIYTKDGIKDFLVNGRISNYINTMFPISKKSRKEIINYLFKRNLDPNDSYKMYISNDTLPNRMVVSIIQNSGIIIGYSHFQKGFNMVNSYIENETVSRIFCDFIENYIPISNIMSNEEANDYIQNLLNEYCK